MTTKVSQLTEDLRRRVRSGEWNTARTLPSRLLLSHEYGVAAGTVSQVLQNLEQEGLVHIIPRKGVIVAKNAASSKPQTETATPATPTIGLCGSYVRFGVPENKGYSGHLINQLLAAAQTKGFPVLILQKRPEDEALTTERCRALGVAGLVFLGRDTGDEAVHLRREGFPVICANRPSTRSPLNYIDCDHVGTVNDIVRRFVEAGHRRISIVSPATAVPGIFTALKPHFLDALLGHQLHYNIDPYWISLPYPTPENREQSYRKVDAMFSLPEPPTAIFCWNDSSVALVTEVLAHRNLKMPGDVSLVHSPIETPENSTLSGYFYSHELFGRMLLDELCETIRNPFHYAQKDLPFNFLDRGSIVAPPA
ncbi:MAG TPA: GntR family transcriptional regulator [Chthoniobacteraceae bacterium]|nr:GntR family transcriptional regulator [Chthoniobacteraceae bacterium]